MSPPGSRFVIARVHCINELVCAWLCLGAGRVKSGDAKCTEIPRTRVFVDDVDIPFSFDEWAFRAVVKYVIACPMLSSPSQASVRDAHGPVQERGKLQSKTEEQSPTGLGSHGALQE
jgi:hypothetical protein